MEKFKITAPNRKDNVSMIRLMTSFVAAKMGFDVEAIDDLKVSAGEALNYQIDKTEHFDVTIYKKEDRIELHFDITEMTGDQPNPDFDKSLSQMILDSLMDTVTFKDNEIIIAKMKDR